MKTVGTLSIVSAIVGVAVGVFGLIAANTIGWFGMSPTMANLLVVIGVQIVLFGGVGWFVVLAVQEIRSR